MYNILHLNSGNLDGGASKGALNLHFQLLNQNCNSRFLTNQSQDKIPNSYNHSIFSTDEEWMLKKSENRVSLRHKLDITYPNHLDYIYTTGFDGFDLLKSKHYDWADVIHLHWVSDGLLQIQNLEHISKPIVWTIRDMWPLTGGCHYTFETGCEKFKKQCGSCPHLASNDEIDLSYIVFSQKAKAYRSNIFPVGISDWITKLSNSSNLFKNNATRIYNGINSEHFYPSLKSEAWNFFSKLPPKNNFVIGYGAAGIGINDKRKGFSYLQQSITKLAQQIPVELLIFGECEKQFNFSTTKLGTLSNTNDLRMAYNCCDVFVAPYLQECFGKTLAEAQSCEIPAICFPGSGSEELVLDGKTGFITDDISVDSLTYSIHKMWKIGFRKRKNMGIMARNRVKELFNIEKNTKEYKIMYENLLEKYDINQLKSIIIQDKRKLIEKAEEYEKKIKYLIEENKKLLRKISYLQKKAKTHEL